MSGPFRKTTASGPAGRRSYIKSQTWYRQPSPRVARLPYNMLTCTLKSTWGEASQYPPDMGSAFGPEPWSDYQTALSKAYDKFKSGLADSASLAETLAERKDSIAMIVKRSTQLLKFSNALRKFRFEDAAKALGMNLTSRSDTRSNSKLNRRSRSRRSWRGPDGRPLKLTKDFGGNFLEFHLGWQPLVGDIGNAINVLQKGIPPVIVKGRGSSKRTTVSRPNSWESTKTNVETRVMLIANVAVTNPNLWLANSLGFVNPASVAWALVPFSFVIDWFVNIGDILGQCTDFLGLSLEYPATTRLDSLSYTYGRTDVYHPGGYTYNAISMSRSLGISYPKLQIRPFSGLSSWRGATAVALLVGFLKNPPPITRRDVPKKLYIFKGLNPVL